MRSTLLLCLCSRNDLLLWIRQRFARRSATASTKSLQNDAQCNRKWHRFFFCHAIRCLDTKNTHSVMRYAIEQRNYACYDDWENHNHTPRTTRISSTHEITIDDCLFDTHTKRRTRNIPFFFWWFFCFILFWKIQFDQQMNLNSLISCQFSRLTRIRLEIFIIFLYFLAFKIHFLICFLFCCFFSVYVQSTQNATLFETTFFFYFNSWWNGNAWKRDERKSTNRTH